MKHFQFCVAETAFLEGYRAVDAWLKAFNEYLMNLSNLRLAGGRDDRPGLSSSGDYSKTAISSWGLHPGVPSNNDDNQVGEDSRDVRKKQ